MAKFGIEVSVTDSDPNAIPWELFSDLGGDITEADLARFTQLTLIGLDRAALKEEEGKGFDKKARVRTDNKWDVPAENVLPFGKIEHYARQNLAEAVLEAYNIVGKKSIVVSGQYLNSNYVFLGDGELIATNKTELDIWLRTNAERLNSPGTSIRIMNVMPYAARLEWNGYSSSKRGRTGNRKKVKSKYDRSKLVSKPNGTYYIAAAAIRRKYKSSLNIRPGLQQNGQNGIRITETPVEGKPWVYRTSYKNLQAEGGTNSKWYPGSYVYPFIVIKPIQEGLV